MTRTVEGLAQVLELSGVDLGVSDWLEIDQGRVNLFAEASGDHQWIHVNQQRAEAGPYGGTIAHGYLTLSLVVPLLSELVTFSHESTTVNYGLNKVRFPAAVPVGGRVRLQASVTSVRETPGGAELLLALTVELEGSQKPACVAEAVYRHMA